MATTKNYIPEKGRIRKSWSARKSSCAHLVSGHCRQRSLSHYLGGNPNLIVFLRQSFASFAAFFVPPVIPQAKVTAIHLTHGVPSLYRYEAEHSFCASFCMAGSAPARPPYLLRDFVATKKPLQAAAVHGWTMNNSLLAPASRGNINS
ncbi:Hypothetical predicted protein [Podarcis lilfordi]|uniref:Uncharacterized protein n=1 Tax=Podarcis lilfordi TaxID=74358 RepID=A0AA35P2P1_9SAUR|nr:Hypothetical predicted protein [Podarcis lilfordi]